MASTYSEYLRLELIGTGDQTGTWGNTTNTNLGTLLDQAVAGTAVIDVTLGDVTLTALNGASDQSRQAILRITGTPIAARNVIAPEQSKWYLVANECGQTVTIKGASTTGYAVANGATLLVFWDGSDFAAGSSTALGYVPVNKAGDTMTGNLILNAAPSTTLGAATKGYVDDAVSGAVGGNFVLKSGDTMTGALTLSGAPTTSLQAATKGYVDSSISGAGYATQAWVTSQNYATNTTQSLQYYYTKTDSDSRYVSVNTQALTYYPLTTTVASTYGALSGNNTWSGTNTWSGANTWTGANNHTQASIWSSGGYTSTMGANGATFGNTNNAVIGDPSGTQLALYVGGAPRIQVYSTGTSFNAPIAVPVSTADTYGVTVTGGGYQCGLRPGGLLFGPANTGFAYSAGSPSAVSLIISNGGIATFYSNGNLSIGGSTAIKASGTTWDNPSDARLKDNVKDYTIGLNEILQVNPKTWTFNGKGGSKAGQSGLGVIADEIASVLPNSVTTYKAKLKETDTEETDIKKFSADEVIWALVNSVKELKAEIDALKGVK